MKQNLKVGDVVMILPHESHGTKDLIGRIGIIRHFLFDTIPIVEIEHSDLPFDYLSVERGAFFSGELLKIGRL